MTDYLEGALPEELHDRFDEHIAHCTGCQAYLAQMRATDSRHGNAHRRIR